MSQEETLYKEILHTLDKLLTNLGLMLEDYDVEYLTQADLYIEIYKVMFPILEPVLSGDFGEDITDEELIQYLVNVLAKDIIKMDLDHIKGELIAQGDAKSILNFLQLLYEISNMVVNKDDDKKKSKKKKNQKLIKSSANSVDQASNHSQKSSDVELRQKYNSVLGINAEFNNSSAAEDSEYEKSQVLEEVYKEDLTGQLHKNTDLRQQNKAIEEQGQVPENSQSVSRISEVSKSKESSEYDKNTKKKAGARGKIDDYNPASYQKASAAKNVSRNSANIREHQVEDEGEEEYREEGQEYEYEYRGEEGGEGEAYYYENGQEVTEPEYINEQDYSQNVHGEDETPKEGEDEDNVDYYERDPINYQRISNTHGRKSQEAERDDIRAIDMKAKSLMQRSHGDEEYEGEGDEYPEGESQQYEVDEDIQVMDEGGNQEEEEEEEMDPRHGMRHMQDVEEVVEEEHEEGYGESERSENRGEEDYYAQQGYEQGYVQGKSKGKGKTKPKGTGKKKKSSKIEETHGKRKVEQRELWPPTAGMKKKDKHNKSMPGKVSVKKSKESISVKKKKLAHSKSERNLNMEEDERPSESVNYEEHSEDHGMEPIDHQVQEEETPSQQGEYEEHAEGEEQYEDQERRELQEDLEQVPDGNIYKILSENVIRVKENLRENREIQDIGFDDEKTLKVIAQQKNQYKQYLNDFMKDHQIREKKYTQIKGLTEKNFMRKMKSEKIRDENLKKDFENQQKSLYFKMRDEKVNYLRKVHKTIFSLEKKRIIEDKKEYMEFRKTKNSETSNMIDSIKNEYKNKLNMLREKNKNDQYERKIASDAQRSFLQALEKEMKAEQMKEAERIKNKWRFEKEKFEMLMKDEGFLQEKVMSLYKKGTF